MSANLTTLANALQWLGQSSDPQDLVARLITATSMQVQRFIGYNVMQASYTRTFNGEGLPKLFVPDIPLVEVSSLTINGVSIPVGVSVGGTQQPGYYFDNDCIALIGYRFCKGFQNITATYTAGYATVPYDLEQAVLTWMKASWANFNIPGVGADATSVAAGDFSINFGGKGGSTDASLVPMPSSVFAVLSIYQRQAMLSGYK